MSSVMKIAIWQSSLTLVGLLLVAAEGSITELPTFYGSEKELCAITLNLTAVGLTQLRKNFITDHAIKRLILQRNDIAEISEGAFDGLPNLLILDLSHNKLSPSNFFSFGSLDKLVALFLDNNGNNQRESSTVEVHYILPQLQYLSLRNCQLRSLSDTWPTNLPKLSHLDLSKNPLVIDEVAPYLPHTLTHLYMEKTGITQFCADGLVWLRSLTLDGNEFEAVGNSDECNEGTLNLYYVKPSYLLELSVVDCRITLIEDDAFQFVPWLKVLNLRNNPIPEISADSIKSLKRLRELDISRTPLKQIPDFSSCEDLTYLYMNEMKDVSIFEKVEAPMLQIKTLKLLSLEGNKIEQVSESAFEGLPALETLSLSRNHLKRLDIAWQARNLRAIRIDDNMLTNLDDVVLSGAKDLRLLDISGNRIERFNVWTIQSYSSNATIEYVPYCG